MAQRKKKRNRSDAMDALSAMGGGQAPAQQPPPPTQPAVPIPVVEPIDQQPADQRPAAPQVPQAPAPRPQQPTPTAPKPAMAPQIPAVPIVPPAPAPADPLQVAGARPAARRVAGAPLPRRRAAVRRTTVVRRQPKAIDPATYARHQMMIPPLLVTGILVLIVATVLATKLPTSDAIDPTRMTMPPHPMLANPMTKWMVLALFPLGAGMLFGAFMFIMQAGKGPPSEDQAVQPLRRYDRGRQTRR